MATRPTVVHVVGTGTIGEPLIGLFLDFKEQAGIDEVTFHKRTPRLTDRPKIRDLLKRGAKLYTDDKGVEAFAELGIEAIGDHGQALERADVVVDCSPVGNRHKPVYERYLANTKGFIAQGSEHGFGKPYARGINDKALVPGEDRFIQVVSCNTHNISVLLHTIGYRNGTDYQNLRQGHFVCMRRANDVSQSDAFVPSPVVGKHDDARFGTHHARDTRRLFETLGLEPDVVSSAVKLPTQYMHALWFDMHTGRPVERDGLIADLAANPYVSVTHKRAENEVFAFGRDHGHYGRILNQTVVCIDTLFIHGNQREVMGYCFTPQDGNSLLSSFAATCWLLDPERYEERLECLRPFFFDEV